MAPPSRFERSTGRAPTSSLATSLTVVVTLLSLVAGVVPTGSASPIRVAPAVASSPVALAATSLAAGGGPAHGQVKACSSSSAGSVVCELRPHPAASGASRNWTDLNSILGSNAPASRWLGQMAYDPADHYVVLFGGDNESVSSGAYSDTWSFANGSWTQLTPSSSPGGRYAAGFAWDAKDGYMVLFGGHDYPSGTDYNDTWTFVHGNWTQLSPTTFPAGRWRFAMSYDYTDGYVVLFGGTDATGGTIYSDTWKFVGGAWTDITKNVTGSPAGRYRMSMVWDSADGYLLMFGGCTSVTCPDSATLTYLNLTWSTLSPTTKPGARVYYGLDFDPYYDAVILFGGSTTTGLNTGVQDTWEWSGGTWTAITGTVGTAPSVRGYVMMTNDSTDNYTLLFGGANPSYQTIVFGDTWILGPNVLARLAPSPSHIDLGQSTSLNATPLAAHGVVTYAYTGLPMGCASSNVSVLTCQPTATGSAVVTVHDSSTAGGVSNATATLNVATDPQISAFTVNRSTVTSGSSVQFSVVASGGQSPYHFGYSGLPSGCSSSNTAVLTCTPNSAGNVTVDVALVDAASYSVGATVNLSVNARPSVSSLVADPPIIDVNQTTKLTATVVGGTAPISFLYSNLPAGCVSSSSATLDCTPTAPGTFPIQVQATDQDGWKSTFSQTLTVNPDPTIVSFAATPLVLDLGSPIHVWLNATGGTGTLTLAYTGFPTGCSLGAAASGSCVPQRAGTFPVTASATDSLGYRVQQSLQLIVNPDPAVTSVTIAPSAIDVGQTAQVQVVFGGGTSPFTFAYTGLPVGCTGTSTAFLNCTAHSSGSFTIGATVTDKLKQSSSLVGSLQIYDLPSVSTFTASATPVTVDTSTVLTAVVTGGGGGNSFVYSGLPAGCATANVSSLTCKPTTTGTFQVEVSVTDSLGGSAHATLNLSVVNAPSTGSSALGGSLGLDVGLIAAVVVLGIVAVLLLRRKPPTATPAAPPPAWSETDEAAPQEPT